MINIASEKGNCKGGEAQLSSLLWQSHRVLGCAEDGGCAGPPRCLGAGVYVPWWPCRGCEGHLLHRNPPSRQLLILLCLPVCGAVGQAPAPRSSSAPGDVRTAAAPQAGSPSPCPDRHTLARGGEFGSLLGPRVCREGSAPAAGEREEGHRGAAVAAEHPAAVEHPAAAARRTGWDVTGRAVAHLPTRCWLLRGSRWVPGGDAAWVARRPGRALRLPLLAAP